jgi:hypothetical protein
MSTKSIIFVTLLIALGLAACTDKAKVENPQSDFMDKLGITINDELLLKDSLNLPDIYCGDPKQQDADLAGKRLDHDQYMALVAPAGDNFKDEMGNWMLLGVRDVGNGVTLAAYYDCNGMGYCVELITYDKNGHLLDAINARELHLIWRCDMSNPNDTQSFTLDSFFTFEGSDSVTLHRVMGQCLMDYENDLKGAPQWQQQWRQSYVINDKGHFVLLKQQVVNEQGNVDEYAALDFKAWDMLVCSLHDESIMDTWNVYAGLISSSYDPDYAFNPFPWDVTLLYKMNPQRFLRWMAAHRGPDNRLMAYFKLLPDERPALLKEIAHLDDAGARQWFTALVNSWDDKPLSKHL